MKSPHLLSPLTLLRPSATGMRMPNFDSSLMILLLPRITVNVIQLFLSHVPSVEYPSLPGYIILNARVLNFFSPEQSVIRNKNNTPVYVFFLQTTIYYKLD